MVNKTTDKNKHEHSDGVNTPAGEGKMNNETGGQTPSCRAKIGLFMVNQVENGINGRTEIKTNSDKDVKKMAYPFSYFISQITILSFFLYFYINTNSEKLKVQLIFISVSYLILSFLGLILLNFFKKNNKLNK